MEIKIGDYRGWKSRIMLSLEVSFKQAYCGGRRVVGALRGDVGQFGRGTPF